jgi:hypothetical protein
VNSRPPNMKRKPPRKPLKPRFARPCGWRLEVRGTASGHFWLRRADIMGRARRKLALHPRIPRSAIARAPVCAIIALLLLDCPCRTST